MAGHAAAALIGDIRPVDDAWSLAKTKFMDGLSEAQKAVFNEATAENLLLSANKAEQDDMKGSKTRKFFEKLEPMIMAVEDYGKALDTYANIASLYLAPIWGSIRVVLAIASVHTRYYTRIIDTLGRIGDILPRLRWCHAEIYYPGYLLMKTFRGLSEII